MLTFDSTSSHYIYLPEGPCADRPREMMLLFLTIFAFNCLLSVNLLRERYSARPRENFKYKFTNVQLCRQSKRNVVFHFLFHCLLSVNLLRERPYSARPREKKYLFPLLTEVFYNVDFMNTLTDVFLCVFLH